VAVQGAVKVSDLPVASEIPRRDLVKILLDFVNRLGYFNQF
jgi:hypothetical protein